MKKTAIFNVLIVYSEKIATSASDLSGNKMTPFALGSRNESYNTVYGYFLENCHKHNLKAAFTSSTDITGAGFCRSYWTFTDNKWHKKNSPCFSPLIFDKFSPTNSGIKSRRQLLFSSPEVKSFNDPDLFNLFFDKQLTYDKLPGYSIPTISLKNRTLESVDDACQTLTKIMDYHPSSNDFSPDLIMKDRFGAGGRHVYKFKAGQSDKMLAVINKNTKISFIIQPFARFDRGYSYNNTPASTDIRIIYLNGQIIQSYIRMAQAGDFRCNEHQGGSLTYLSLKEIPSELVAKSNSIAQFLNKKCSLYALDFIISNSGNTYLLEGNTGPGLDWNMSLIKNEIKPKNLSDLLLKNWPSVPKTLFLLVHLFHVTM